MHSPLFCPHSVQKSNDHLVNLFFFVTGAAIPAPPEYARARAGYAPRGAYARPYYFLFNRIANRQLKRLRRRPQIYPQMKIALRIRVLPRKPALTHIQMKQR